MTGGREGGGCNCLETKGLKATPPRPIFLCCRKQPTSDPRIIELLLARAEMTFQEVTEQWSQRPHLLALLQPELKTPVPVLDQEVFFDRFINGTLLDSDLWLGHDSAAQQRALTAMRTRRESGSSSTARDLLSKRRQAADGAAATPQLR